MKQAIDLNPEHHKIVSDILYEYIPDRKVLVFGSRAKWTAKNTSDLDLCIMGDEKLPSRTMLKLAEAFDESPLPFKVDLVEWAGLEKSFQEIVRKDGVALGWPIVRLGKYCEKIGSGATPTGGKERYLSHGPYTLIRSQNVYNDGFKEQGLAYISERQANDLDNVTVKENDVLLNITGDSVARCSLVDNSILPARVNQHVAIIRPQPQNFDFRFLRYFLVSPMQQEVMLGFASSGATRNALTKSMIESFFVPMPPPKVQSDIGDILSSLDEQILNNQRMNETLEGIARGLFKSWFVNFDPVHAKAEGRIPEGMGKNTADLFPASFSKDGAPEGWKLKKLSDAIDLNPTEKLSQNALAPYLDMAALPTQGSWPDMPIRRKFKSGSKFRNGDTLLARITPCLENGKTAYINCLEQDQVCAGSTEFIVMRPKSPLPEEYAYLLARHDSFREHAIQSMTGTSGRQRVQTEALGKFEIYVPTETVALRFKEFVSPLFNQIKANCLQINSLSQIRDALLPKLISGDIRVKVALEKQGR